MKQARTAFKCRILIKDNTKFNGNVLPDFVRKIIWRKHFLAETLAETLAKKTMVPATV
jgi:hypothetical protein